MIRKRKSGFLTFCFSFIPGVGEMYLGFMKMGLSLMGLFFLIIGLGEILHVGAIFYLSVVVWFYSFFHVHNLAGLSDSEFLDTKDEFLFDLDKFFNLDKKNIEKYRRVIANILIIIGVLLLWNGVKSAFLPLLPEFILKVISRLENTVPQIIVGIGIIVGGFYMIKGKKEITEKSIINETAQDPAKESSDMQNSEAERNVYGTESDKQNA